MLTTKSRAGIATVLSAGLLLALPVAEARSQQVRKGQNPVPPVVQQPLAAKAPNVVHGNQNIGQGKPLIGAQAQANPMNVGKGQGNQRNVAQGKLMIGNQGNQGNQIQGQGKPIVVGQGQNKPLVVVFQGQGNAINGGQGNNQKQPDGQNGQNGEQGQNGQN